MLFTYVLRFNRPVMAVLTRHEDGVMTGKRHEIFTKYDVGFSSSGKITALNVESFANCGHTTTTSDYVRNHGL